MLCDMLCDRLTLSPTVANLALKVLVANPHDVIDHKRMMDLFFAIITKVYDYEHTSKQYSKLDKVFIVGRGSFSDANNELHLQAALVGPSGYRKIVQAAEDEKRERRKRERSEEDESPYESDSSSSVTEVSTCLEYCSSY